MYTYIHTYTHTCIHKYTPYSSVPQKTYICIHTYIHTCIHKYTPYSSVPQKISGERALTCSAGHDSTALGRASLRFRIASGYAVAPGAVAVAEEGRNDSFDHLDADDECVRELGGPICPKLRLILLLLLPFSRLAAVASAPARSHGFGATLARNF